jgi:hypothetical protein
VSPGEIICLLTIWSFPSGEVDDFAVHRLIESGMVRVGNDARYTVTSKGAVMVEALGNVPEPVQVWAIPKRETP